MAEDRKNMTEPARVFLDRWLASMGSALPQWRRSYLPADFPFDFTLDSLDALEPIVLARYPDQDAIDVEDNAEFTTGTVRYIGEVLLRVAPARWGYQDRAGDDLNPYNRTAVIRSNTPAEFRAGVIPEFYLRQLVRDRERGTLQKSATPLLAACREAGRADPPATRDAVRTGVNSSHSRSIAGSLQRWTPPWVRSVPTARTSTAALSACLRAIRIPRWSISTSKDWPSSAEQAISKTGRSSASP